MKVNLTCKTMCLALIGALVFGFVTHGASRAVAAPEQVIRFGLGSDPSTLDPGITDDNSAGIVVQHCFEGLIRNRDNKLVPGIAESWDISEDGRTYTFHLREAKWSDGKPLTAKDFEYAWKRVLTPATGANYTSLLYSIKGAEASYKGEGKAEDVGIKAVDDKTLVVELAHPTPYFLELTAFGTFAPVRQDMVEAAPDRWALSAKTYVSDGPYIMTEYAPDGIVLEKNPEYWNAAEVKMPRIEFSLIVDNSTEMAAFENGELNVMRNFPPAEIDRVSKMEGYTPYPYISTSYYQFNTTKKPLDDVRVRRALALAINRRKMVDIIRKGGKPATNIVAFGIMDNDGNDFATTAGTFDFVPDGTANVEEARRLLAEAGYPDGKGFPELSYLYNTSEGNKQTAELLQEMWRSVLGINVKLMNQEWKVFLESTKAGNFEIARKNWIGDFADPMTYLELYTSFSNLNDTRWKNDEYDKLIMESMKQSGAERFETLYKADRLLMEEMPGGPLFWGIDDYVISPNIKGIEHLLLGKPYFGNAVIE